MNPRIRMKFRLRRWLLMMLVSLVLSVAGDLILPGMPAVGVVTAEAVTFKNKIPKLESISAGSGKITTTWGSVSGATSYYIYRKSGTSRYKKLAKTTGTYYIDKNVDPGITYTYTVRGVKISSGKEVLTSYSEEGISAMTKVPLVELDSLTMSGKKTCLKWQQVKKVDGYIIYKKSSASGYQTAATIEGGDIVSWKDADVMIGETYTYTVRAYVRDGSTIVKGSYYNDGISLSIPPTTPSLSVKTASGRNLVKWKSAEGVDGYYVYRKTEGSSYRKIDIVKGRSFYQDRNVTYGETYIYAVRGYAITDNGTLVSGYKEASVQTKPEATQITSLMTNSKKTKDQLEWTRVALADGYSIYKKSEATSNKWQLITSVDNSVLNYSVDRTKSESASYAVRSYVLVGSKKVLSRVYDNLSNAAPAYKKYTILFEGDSITRGYTWGASNAVVSYPVRVSQLTGAVVDNLAVTNATVAKRSASNQNSIWYRMVAAYGESKKPGTWRPEEPETKPTQTDPSESDGGDEDPTETSSTQEQDGGDVDNSTMLMTALQDPTVSSEALLEPELVSMEITVDCDEEEPEIVADSDEEEPETVADSDEEEPETVADSDEEEPETVADSDEEEPETVADSDEEEPETVADSDMEEPSEEEPETSLEALTEENEALDSVGASTSTDSFNKTAFQNRFGYYDVICIAAGTNDWNYNISMGDIDDFTSTTFYGAWNQIFDRLLYLKSQNEKLKIVLITPMFRGRYGSKDYSKVGMNEKNTKGLTLQDYVDALYVLRNKYASEIDIYIYNSVDMGIVTKKNYLTTLCDALHPTRETYTKIGYSVAEYLKKYVLKSN